jgi:hypothetical protein
MNNLAVTNLWYFITAKVDEEKFLIVMNECLAVSSSYVTTGEEKATRSHGTKLLYVAIRSPLSVWPTLI